MADKLKLAWYNGMNIDKIHFEQQERYLEHNINIKTISSFCNLYGLLDIEFSSEMLKLGQIALKKISGIAKDGSIFFAPEQDLLPQALHIEHSDLKSSIITLKIPISSANSVELCLKNSLSNSKYIATRSYICSKIQDDIHTDVFENFEENDEDILDSSLSQEKVNVVLASLRLKLGILGDKTSDELEIPICKIKNISSNKVIELDEKFIPTSLDLSKNIFIKSFFEEMIFATRQHKEVLAQIFKGIDQNKNTLDFSTYLSLNLLKKWHLIFSYLFNKEKLHPEFLYEKLVEFQCDLLSLSSDDKFGNFIPYQHEDLSSVFLPFINNLRILFANISSPKYSMAQIIDLGNGFYDCLFDNAGIIENGDIFLAVNAETSMDYLLENFKFQSKISTQSKIKNIVASQLRGINIEQIPSIPSVLPHLNGYVYYRIDKKDSLFQNFRNENVVSIYLTNNIKNPDIKMWVIL